MGAHELATAPSIDGDVLGDAAWKGANPASDFWQIQPNDGQPSTQKTEVFVGFTARALYIGVVAYDDNPDLIIVTDSRRDSDLDDTDAFLVLIDGLLDRQNGFIFGTNAAGIEYDGQVANEGSGGSFGGGGFNRNWDGSWAVQAKIAAHGWSAEFEIPFRTLRFGPEEIQDWGINFQRNIRRNNEVAFWVPLERNHDLTRVSDAGTLRGVAPSTQRNLQITPYVLGNARRGNELDGTETDGDFGFDVKYSVTPSLTLDLTYNTDFAQVEVDEQQVNLDRFNLFFPEKRPFFLENSGLFSVGTSEQVEVFFSRKIGISDDGDVIPVDGGARLSGRIGERTNIGLLHMVTDAEQGVASGNEFTVARVSQELRNRSGIGVLFTNRDGDGSHLVAAADDYNRALAVDGRWGIGDKITLEAWFAKTDTPGYTGKDDAFNIEGNYSSAEWEADLRYTQVGEDFNPEVGFLSRTEYRNVRTFLLRTIRPDDLWGLLEIRPHVSYTGFWKFDDFQETGFLHIDNHWVYRSGTEFHTGVNFTKSGVIEAFDIVAGVTIQPGTYDHTEVQLVYFTDESKPFSFHVRTNVGGRFGGDRVLIQPSINYRIGETFRSEFSITYNDFDLPVPNGEFTANLARLRLSYSFTPKIQLQALIQYNELDDTIGTNIRFSWLRSANSGLYLVYNELDERSPGAPPTEREFILKYSHIFDVFD
ncbi:MAG: carbohydrate binding family 9 domain-containing protein [Gammaproteobacteria bacterium]|nr:carbohydrate binding family 9 domain-containing protein [Gammaproteobacteria bacterium]